MKNFEDAQEMQKQHPETFEAPSQMDLERLETNQLVKVCVSEERFWCKVLWIKKDKIKAVVDNDLAKTKKHGIKYKDEIKFKKKHIYKILG